MEIDKNFKGYKTWKEGSKQTIIGEPGDTKEDAIKFMHAHLDYFDLRGDFTFNAGNIVQNGNEFIFTMNRLGHVQVPRKFRLGNGVQVEID
ncbi:hypothetical protein GCM10007423_39680 [Dyadobacter endophyticus]|uniref:Uncharacterized protein n=1 Tax=Dyadobacter endophyticus TaxID=1749036 RepID=A0ABQ1Z067_9BACT|nr:hypothetical protein [Dyadobacter endophyticus]GGH42794.1 hypothetical protein GCM10007423_39680 [Dyadobacter endophyticus]